MMHIPAHKNVAHPPGQYQPVEPDYLIPADGYADGGEPYTDEELEFLQSEVSEAAS